MLSIKLGLYYSCSSWAKGFQNCLDAVPDKQEEIIHLEIPLKFTSKEQFLFLLLIHYWLMFLWRSAEGFDGHENCTISTDGCSIQLLEYYADDIPNPSTLEAELHLWKCKWATTPSSDLPDTPAKALKKANESIFPNIHQLLRIICTIPVSSCECERSIAKCSPPA